MNAFTEAFDSLLKLSAEMISTFYNTTSFSYPGVVAIEALLAMAED